MAKFLLDENLSPQVAIELRASGHDVVHLRERGRLRVSDPEVLELAFTEDRILVTANVGDFRKLASSREVHPGIVLLADGALRRSEQLEIIRVVATLDGGEDLVNRVVTVGMDGAMLFEELPVTTG